MATVTGSIVDEGTGERIEARVQVLDSTGIFTHAPDAILKVGTGDPFFYSDGSFSVEVPRGKTRIAVERGTEYVPADITIDAPSRGAVAVDVALRRWSSLSAGGWHPGNTHIHYDEDEERPDDRLRLDPRIEDLRMTAVSILRRRGLDYATNKYPPGVLTEMSSPHHHVQCGQENRHNSSPWDIGYGHVMLLNVRNVVEPVRKPRRPRGRLRSRLPSSQLRLRRRPAPGRPGNLVPQWQRHGGARGRCARKAGPVGRSVFSAAWSRRHPPWAPSCAAFAGGMSVNSPREPPLARAWAAPDPATRPWPSTWTRPSARPMDWPRATTATGARGYHCWPLPPTPARC